MKGKNIAFNDKKFSLGPMPTSSLELLQQHFSVPSGQDDQELNKRVQLLLKKFNPRVQEQPKFDFEQGQSTVEDFLYFIKALPFFRRFRTLHFFLHEKGLNACLKYEFSDAGLTKTIKDITDFNRLFQSIKKSKNKSFGQSTLKGFDFEILGTFLARNYTTSRHNSILIISRDDFLPQSEEDISEFKLVSDQLQHQLEQLLILSTFSRNTQLIATLQDELKQKLGSIPDQVDLFHKERIRLLGELLNTLRHEISNPLFGLKLSTDLISMDQLNPTQLEFVQEITSSLQRCTDIIEDFTDLYKSDKVLKRVSVAQIIKEVLTISKSETRTIAKTTVLAPGEQDLAVTTNPTWLVQILFNLVINATQSLKESKVTAPTISIVVERADQRLVITVSDNGPGVSADKIQTIFQPFYTTKSTGTGLGLPISRSLAKKMGGDLEYLARNEGACFKLSIPYE